MPVKPSAVRRLSQVLSVEVDGNQVVTSYERPLSSIPSKFNGSPSELNLNSPPLCTSVDANILSPEPSIVDPYIYLHLNHLIEGHALELSKRIKIFVEHLPHLSQEGQVWP